MLYHAKFCTEHRKSKHFGCSMQNKTELVCLSYLYHKDVATKCFIIRVLYNKIYKKIKNKIME